MKTIAFMALVTLTITLTACAGGGDDAPASSGGPSSESDSKIITEAEQTADLEALNSKENSLADVGLKFDKDVSYNNGLSSIRWSWDQDYLRRFGKSHPQVTQAQMIPALEAYVEVANAFLQKYSGVFEIQEEDGTVSTKELLESVRQEIEAKVKICNSTIAALKKI